jgi:hypothetical protein
LCGSKVYLILFLHNSWNYGYFEDNSMNQLWVAQFNF